MGVGVANPFVERRNVRAALPLWTLISVVVGTCSPRFLRSLTAELSAVSFPGDAFLRLLPVIVLATAVLQAGAARAEVEIPLIERHGTFSAMDEPGSAELASSLTDSEPAELTVSLMEPLNGTIFPPDFAPPLFSWAVKGSGGEAPSASPGGYLVSIMAGDRVLGRALTDLPRWIPEQATWERVCNASSHGEGPLRVLVSAIGGWDGRTVTGQTSASFSISDDPVGADVFFLRKPVPFAVGQAHPEMSQWLRADLSVGAEPSTVLQGLPVCGNCHAFSRNGNLLGMDIDVDGDKGGYLLAPVSGHVKVERDNVMSWNARAVPLPVEYSFGLFTQLSDDGRYAASTVGESSIFIRMNDVAFSQLFFPVTGRVGIYDIERKRHFDLPGADDSRFVQTCPAFSPDTATVAFSRAPVNEAYVQADLGGSTKNEPIESSIYDLNRKYPIQYDIWTVPFNEGKGGEPKPLAGASGNGMSNYFPRYSPDSRWIVFVQAPTGLVLQPGSRLAIVPAEGGKATTLASNVEAMNSWHSWSPNGRWLVFSGKDRSPVTELFLTHINDEGEASPAIRLFRLTSSSMAAMVPEFVPESCDGLSSVSFGFGLDGSKQSRSGNVR